MALESEEKNQKILNNQKNRKKISEKFEIVWFQIFRWLVNNIMPLHPANVRLSTLLVLGKLWNE